MALDVFVMPMWRFKAGYFESPLETKLGVRPTIVAPGGVYSLPNAWTWFSSLSARRQVRSLKKAVAAQTGVRINWNDNGQVVYSERPGSFVDLRAYAKWLDYRDRLPEFTVPADRNFPEHPVWELKDKGPLSCPHLVSHDCYSGPAIFRGRLHSVPRHGVRIGSRSRIPTDDRRTSWLHAYGPGGGTLRSSSRNRKSPRRPPPLASTRYATASSLKPKACFSVPARVRTWSTTFAGSRASVTLRGQIAEGPGKSHVLYGTPLLTAFRLIRCQNIRSPHNGSRLLALRCRKPPKAPQADTCPASPSSVPSTGR